MSETLTWHRSPFASPDADRVGEPLPVERTQGDGAALYGFITVAPAAGSSVDARRWLAGRLPDFMTPRQVLIVPGIPLLPVGQVDHGALLEHLPVDPPDTGAALSRKDAYGRLAHAWDAVLGQGAQSHASDFHALGGDSLKLMQLSLQIERAFGRSLPLEAVLADARLPNLARLLEIDCPRATQARPEGLSLRPIWPGRQPSRGIALAMPGWHGSALRAFARPARGALPAALHIRRAPLPACGIGVRAASTWHPDDNIRMTIELPTVGQERAGHAPGPRGRHASVCTQASVAGGRHGASRSGRGARSGRPSPNTPLRFCVLTYRQTGYWEPHYPPKDTDVLCLFRITACTSSAGRCWARSPSPSGGCRHATTGA